MEECIITRDFVQTIIGKRKREIHKGDCGRILIAAGSVGMAGAAVLCAKGALRSGSGLVQVAVPKELFPIVQTGVPEATCLERDFSKIDLGVYDAVCVGPGLGQTKDSVDAVIFLLKNYKGPMVVDADGLNIIAKENLFHILEERPAGMTVITPHAGEARRLLGGKEYKDRKAMVLALYEKTKAISVLKGHATLVAADDTKAYTNITGNPGMATAGSGDVLAGIITGLMGQKMNSDHALSDERISPVNAAKCGVFIHGLAGDTAAETVGEYGLIAGDIAYYTAIAIKGLSD